jgi:RecB family exonuclease
MASVHAPAGTPALLALRDTVLAVKRGDPLAPVTVVVPSSYAALSLRRLLAAGDLGPSPRSSVATGLVNVRFLVAARVAELLGAATLAAQGRRPVSRPVRAEAVRSVLAERPLGFAPVAGHPATERALDRVFAELRACDDATLDRLAAQSRRAGDVVAVHRAVRGRLTDWYDERDLLDAAVDAIRAGSPALADLGHLVVFRTSVVDGSPSDDEVAATLVSALGDRATEVVADLDVAAVGTAVVSVPDADEEARAVARGIVARARAGTPLHRIAVAHPGVHPYGPLLDQHLTAAGIPHNGPAVRTLAHSVPGTTLLGLLDLAEHGLRRDEVIGWLTGAPALDPATGQPVPAAAWDTESRQAGVVAGIDQWDDRLTRHGLTLAGKQKELLDDPDVDQWRVARLGERVERIESLRAFVHRLDEAVDVSSLASWVDFVGWARRLLDDHLGGPSARARWPEVEQQSWDAVAESLQRLSVLDGFGVAPELTTFRRAVERDLDVPAGRVGAFGDGVFVAPLPLLAGVDVDVVFVLGMVEGTLPGPSRADAMLAEAERLAAGGALGRGGRGLDEQRHTYLAALAAARVERVLVAPRADLSRNREHLPSRWLLATAAAVAGAPGPIAGADLADLARAVDTVTFVPSFRGGFSGGSEPASLQDRDLAELARWDDGGGIALDHHLTRQHPRFGAGLVVEAARRSGDFTPFDGRVTMADGVLPATSPLSPTSLETYAACPRKYLLSRVLSVAAVDKPEEVPAISPADRGSVIHAILDDHITGVIAGQPRTLDRLLDIGKRHLDEFEHSGNTGRPLRWRYDRQLIERELRRFHGEDHLTPLAAELEFGVGDEPPVRVVLPGGRELRFKGYADRVDRSAGGRLVVTDYKTGRAARAKDFEADPVVRGTKLQLPIYGLAARDRFGESSRPVLARYWYVSEKGGFSSVEVELDDRTLARFTEAVTVVVDGVTSGLFPAHPGEPSNWPVDSWENCRYCEYDRLCPTDRGRQWERKRHAPVLAAYADLADGSPEPAANGAGA